MCKLPQNAKCMIRKVRKILISLKDLRQSVSASAASTWFRDCRGRVRGINAYLRKDFENNNSILTLERRCRLPVHLVVEDRVEKSGILLGLGIELV